MRDLSLHVKCREWLNQRKETNTFISTITHTNVSFQSHTREEISIWHERERKEANICGLEMEIKSLLLVFILVPPSPCLPLPPHASFWLLAFYSPISGWEYMAGWMVWFPAKPQHRKWDLSCMGWTTVLYSFHMDTCACTWWSNTVCTCKPGFPSPVELLVKRDTKNYLIIGKYWSKCSQRGNLHCSSFFFLNICIIE